MRAIPFFANRKDDTHCYQAAIRMVLKYFIPHKTYSWKQLDKIGEKVATEQILHSDVAQAAVDAKKLIRNVTIQKRIPTFDDIHALLGDQWLLVCLVNAQTLNRKKGYVGHFVVVWKCTGKMVFLHDPGLPPRKNRRVTRRVFEEAWADPNERAKGVMAFRL